MVSLNPPWNRIFRGENVTLTCNGNNSFEVNATKWAHNNTMLVVTTSSLEIINATIQHSGEYRCQNKNFIPSQPVYLEVFSGKFQGYGNIDSLMWEMAHLNLGRSKLSQGLGYQDGTQGLSLKTHPSLFSISTPSTCQPFCFFSLNVLAIFQCYSFILFDLWLCFLHRCRCILHGQ